VLGAAGHLLALSDLGVDEAEGRRRAEEALRSGAARERYDRWIRAQGGDPRREALPRAAVVLPVPAPGSGYVQAIATTAVGLAALHLGAGRVRKEDDVDHAVGVVCLAKRGDRVKTGEPLAEVHARDEASAARAAEEAYEIALQTGQRPQEALSLSVRALVRASLGAEADARADANEALALAGERGMAITRIQATWALGLLELSLERPEEAARLIAPERERLLAAGVGEPGTVRFIPDEIEALVALGRLDEAETRLVWLDERARTLGRLSALAAAARCSGLLAAARGESDAALADFERALGEHDRFSMPFERARTLLALGGAQRRAKKKAAARETLGVFGKLDILVNCAGITKRRPSLEVEEEEWGAILDTNLSGAFRACQVFGRPMLERGWAGRRVVT